MIFQSLLTTFYIVSIFIFCELNNVKGDAVGSFSLLKEPPLLNNTAPNSANVENFQNCVDHNDKKCIEKWNQRYWVNRAYYKKGGPIFFMLGIGDSSYYVNSLHWRTYATKYGAILVALEHRFYGGSQPTKDRSLKSLQLMASQQALADASKFIKWFKKENKLTGVKTAVFGGGYGGNLAAWFRQKYPKDANLAVASSAPLEAVYDFSGFMGKMAEVIKKENEECYHAIDKVFKCMADVVNGVDSGCSKRTRQDMPPILRLCYDYDFDNKEHRELFFSTEAIAIWGSGDPYRELLPRCRDLMNRMGSSSDVINDYGQFLNDIRWKGTCEDDTSGSTTTDSSGSSTTKLTPKPPPEDCVEAEGKTVSVNSNDDDRRTDKAGWFWQMCYELGFIVTPDPVSGIFGKEFGPDVYANQCKYIYGETFTPTYIQDRVKKTNNYYKGKGYDGTCTIFVNGEYDPWSTQGITQAEQTSSKNAVFYMSKASHCEDMGDTDNEDISRVQTQIQALIGKYLKDPSC